MFEEFAIQHLGFSSKHLSCLTPLFKSVTYKRNDFILKRGEVEEHVKFIEEGVTRLWVPKGEKEITYLFSFPGEFTSCYESFHKQETSLINHQCITDVKVRQLSAKNLFKIIEKFPELNKVYIHILNKIIFQYTNRKIDLLSNCPQEYYKMLLKERPQYIQQIPQKMLAPYLGITPEALSRIRKRIY